MLLATAVFVGGTVTLSALLEITNTLFNMLASNGSPRVLVAAIASVCLVVVLSMASLAGDIMVTIEQEVATVVESGR